MSQEILVIGSGGKTGSRVFQRLVQRGAKPRPASRSSAIPFDWYREETWPQALRGVGVAYVTFQPDLAVPGSVAIIERFVQVAGEAGTRRIVLLSGRGEREAEDCERIVMRGLPGSIVLRASFFMQNFSEGVWVDGIRSGELVLPHVSVREPFVHADDIADMAVEALLNEAHGGKTFELTGPRLLSFEEAVGLISDALKTKVALVSLPVEQYASVLRDHGVPEDVIWLISYLFTEVLDGRNESVRNDIREVLKREPRSFGDYVSETAATGAWR